MNEELQSLVERAMAAGRSREQILTVLKDNGLDDAGVLSVDSYIKKKSPSALEGSASQSDLRPSVSESLSSERVQLGFNEAAIKQQKKAIADAAAAQVYTAVAQTKGDLNKIQDKQAFANAYTTYRSLSDDPRAAVLPQNPVTQTGEIDYAVVPTLKKGAIDYVNELIKQEQQRKADLGSKFTVPVLSEVATGTESIIGGLLKFNEMITGQDSELANFFLDDAAQRSRDALIDYGLTEEQISKGFLGNIGEGNVGAGLAIFGSTLVQQVPQLAAVAATGGAAGLGLLGASAAGSGYSELQNRSDLSEGEKMLYGIGVGAAEYLAEKLFLGDVNMLRKAFSKEAIEGMTKKELGDMLFGAVPKGVRSVMEEGTEEVLTSVAQQTLAKVIAGEEFNPIEIAESAIYGGAAGGGVYLLSRGVGAIVDPENEAKIRGLRSGLKKTQEAAKDPDLTEQEKEVLGRRAQEYTDGIEQLKRRDDEKVASMTPEDQDKLKSLQVDLKKKVLQLKRVKSEEAFEQLKSEILELSNNIQQLSDKYDRQEEAGVPSPIVEGEAVVEAQPIEGTGQEAPEAGGVLQVPVEEGPEEVVAIQEAPITEEVPIVEELPAAEPEAISDVKLTAEEVLFPSGQGDALGALFSDIVGVVYDTGLTKKGSDARFNWIRKYVDPTITEANARKEGFDFVNDLLNYRIEKGLFNISRDKYDSFANAVKRLGLDIDAIAKEVSQTDFKEYYDTLLADKRKTQAPAVEPAPIKGVPMQVKAPIVNIAELRSRLKNWDKPDAELNEKKQVIEDFISLYSPGDIVNISAKAIFQQYKDGKPVKGKFNDVSLLFKISDEGKDTEIWRIVSGIPRVIGSREERNSNGTLKMLAANKIFSTISGILGSETATIEVIPQTTEDKRMSDLIARSFHNPSFPIIPSIRLKSGESVRIPSGITEDELVSYLIKGRVQIDDGRIIKISDIESVTGDGALVERKEKDQAPQAQEVQEAAPDVDVFQELLQQRLEEQNKSGYRYGQYGGKYSDTYYIQDSTGKTVKEIKEVEGDTYYRPKTKLEIYKWIDSQAGTRIADIFIEENLKQGIDLREEVSQTPTAEPATVEQPVQEAAPVEEIVAAEEVSDEEKELLSDIEVDENKIAELVEFEIPTEKSNYDEEVKRIKEEIAKVRASKAPADEKRDLIDDLKAQIEDARDSYENIVEIYKEEIKALKADIKKAQKRLDKIREKKTPAAVPVEAPVQEAPSAVSTNANGNAFISQQDFKTSYPELFSFLNTGEIYRRERGASTSRNRYLRGNQDTTNQILRSQYLGIFDAKDILVMMSSYKPRTKADIDRFNKAYLQVEQLFAGMQKAQKNDVIYKTKAQIIAVINRQSSLSQKQKDVLASVVNTIKSDKLFNINFKGEKDFYEFASNLLKANNGRTFIHEVGHWGYYNLLSPQDRIDYMNYMSEKFLNRELTGLVFPAQVSARSIGGVNAKDSYQEYFATQFDQWYVNEVGAEGILLKLYNTFKEIVDNLINLFREKGYNPDLVRYFDKIADVTKYDGNAKQDDAINQQLVDDLNTGDEEFGNPGIISESISEPEKTEDLDIKQEDWKDRAKKSWRSFWWSDEQRKIRTYKESLNSQLSREAKKFTEFATALNDLLRKSDKPTADLVGKVMDGSISEEELATLRDKKDGQLLFSLSNAMREYIDSLSEDIIFSPAFTKLSRDLQNTILENLGTYLRGTYRFWKDKRFFPGEATIKAAIEEVYNEFYSKEFDSLVSMFDVVETRDEISNLEKAYETAREKLIEEERQLPAGEKTTEVKNLIAQLELIGNELNEKRKLFKLQKELMNILIGTSEITDENVALFLVQKDDYVDKQIEEAAPRLKAEAKDYVKAYLEEAKNIRESDKYKGLGMVSPSSIKVPDKQFKQKKNLTETFRDLLGEEKDPVVRFLDTAQSLSNIKYKGDMILKIATQFKGTPFVKTEATEAELASKEYRQVTDKFSPLNGKYVHKDVFDAITDRRLYEGEAAWWQAYLNLLLLARKSKVIYNVPTWRKNLTGGWWTMMANGVINPEFIQDLGRRGKLLRDKRADPETEALLDIMAEFGLLGQGVNANLIGGVNAMYERAATGSDMDYLNSMQKLGERIKGFDQWLGDKYSSVDDYTKLVVFRKEIKSFAVKLFGKSYDQLTEGEKKFVHEEAAERVKQSTPTFSRLPPVYYRIAQMPLGDFLSFEFEAFRSFTANFANGYLDIQTAMKGKDKDGNSLSAEQKAEYMKEGVARLMGTAAVFGMRFSIPAILAGMALGDDDELEEDIKALRPNWMEGHSIIPTAITKDGIATTYDYSMEDPYGTIVDVVTDPLSFPGHMIDMLNPNMAVTFLFNLYDSKDIYGKDIVNSYDSPFTKAYKYGGYTLKSLILPPFATSAVRDELRRQEIEAERYSPLDAVGRVTSRAFIRDYTFDTGTQLYFFGQQFATKQEQYTDLTGIARRNRLAELEEVRKMYKAIINIGIKKGNTKMIVDANKNIKRQFKPAEEVYILTGYEIPEQK